MNEIQTLWKDATSFEDRLTLLAREGRKAAVRANRELATKYQANRTGIWPFCVAQSLVRSTHAHDHDGWITAAAQFLKTNAPQDLIPARGHSCSFGADALQRALISFCTLGSFTGIAAPRPYDAARLAQAQDSAVGYVMKKDVPGLGAWLFCAPFELMAVLRPSLWDDPVLDNLLLPLGSALARGYGMLKKADVADLDEQLLRDTEPGLRNGLTLLFIARGADEKLAQLAKTRALFIHYGIQELGQAR